MSSDLWGRIEALYDEDEDAFQVLKPAAHIELRRPLVVLVHPGDAVEEVADAGRQVATHSRTCQEGMGAEIMAVVGIGGADLVVVHRVSSHYGLTEGCNVAPGYLEAIGRIHDHGAVLYGDDLDAVAAWIEEKLCASARPSVLMTGAWSHAEYGCVTTVGKALQALGANVALSIHSPSNPGTFQDRWEPAAGCVDAPAP